MHIRLTHYDKVFFLSVFLKVEKAVVVFLLLVYLEIQLTH